MIVVVMSLSTKFAVYSTMLSMVVSSMKGRKVNIEHREEVSARDKAQAVVAIIRNHRIMKSQGREFHRVSGVRACKEQ